MFALHAYKSKTNFKNVVAGIKKANLHSTRYSHFLPALKEVKNVANNKLKNETRELAKDVTIGCNLFEGLIC